MSDLPGTHGILPPVPHHDPALDARRAPDPDDLVPTLYTGIVLYSADEPEASAMLVADGLIAWVGAEDSARVIPAGVRTVDATGCLVTPGFVDAAATADGTDPAPEAVAAAAARGVVRLLPGPTGEREGVRVIAPVTETAPYLDLLSDGTPLAFASAGQEGALGPWSWVRAAAHQGEPTQRISDRAAFLAATRGGQRVAGHRHPGSLRTGIEATFVVWEPWDLTVRGHGDLIDTWSTDPRSRTPLLPDLDQGAPRALRTVVDGAIVHDLIPRDGA